MGNDQGRLQDAPTGTENFLHEILLTLPAFISHNQYYSPCACGRKVRMSHICKVEVSHFPVDQAGLECGRGIDDHERARAEPD